MSLVIDSLTKTYDNGVKALDNLSLTIKTGLFGLLGPNGAGKSSLMRTLATLQQADSGSILLDDIDVFKHPEKMRQVIGYLPQEFGVFPGISAERLLDYYALLKGINDKAERKDKVHELLELVNLFEQRHKHVATFSGGMKQRFGIAQCLLGDPKLIIVDEPTAGLDPSERVRFNNLLCRTGENRIVLLSTHIVDDVNDLCSDTAIMNNGRIIARGNPEHLINDLGQSVWKKPIQQDELNQIKSNHKVLYTRLQNGVPMVSITSETNPGDGFALASTSLEDVYFNAIDQNEAA